MAPMFQDEGSSSATSSPLQCFSMISLSPSLGSPYPWLKELKSEDRGLYLIHLLLTCANHVATGSLENANVALEQISQLAAANGDTMALNSTKISLVLDEILVRKVFFEMLPFLKVAFVFTNQAIMEAMEGEKMVHIIDLNAAEPVQWITLLQVLSARPEGPPHLRITSVHQRKEVLDQMAHRLTEEAEKLDIPFQFCPIISKLENLDMDKLRLKTGEALAISPVLQLHSFLASDDGLLKKKSPLASKGSNGNYLPRALQMSQGTLGELLEKEMGNGFLNAFWGLTSKVMVITEQDSNHNGSTLMERLLESLYSYAALFDCLESMMLRTSLERLKVEKMLFGEKIKNIIACEGSERTERHEKLEKWIQRLDLAGFGNVPLSYYGMLEAKRMLHSYGCDRYRMREKNGCVLISWQDRPLFSMSAWRCRK
ncbi:hypothetical protein C1H46_012762 [Malus baccata]|uniref:Uncharacterized protein n=1 Tax=Malus baccata TaxID=106549 RepID=A0A540MTS5_MALBA|nr:hypothetical protein C1H46_012762 [Malus baccata]